jgi:hypothetical protein
MSERDPDDAPGRPADETVLARWSRLKARARDSQPHPPVQPQAAPEETAAEVPATPVADQTLEVQPETAPPVPLPDLDSLDQDSDYSAFLTRGVDSELRKRALRKLFHSPKFNVFDGLDTYRDDFTEFPTLGAVVTADMRHQLERVARELAQRAEDAIGGEAPPAEPRPPPAIAQESTEPAHPPTTRNEDNEDDAEHGPA